VEKYGMRISAPGKPVQTATGEDVLLSSARNNLKFPGVRSTVLTFSGGAASVDIPHGKNFRPAFLVFLQTTNGYYILPTYVLVGLSDAYADATNLHISLQGAFVADGTQFTCYYYISDTESAE
jgi:hypothetical protein